MFGKKIKNKRVEPTIHPILGEIKYLGYGWNPLEKIKLSLWSRVYEIQLCFIADSEDDVITEKQETAFEKFKNVIIDKKVEIEKAIISYARTEDEEIILSRLIPSEIYFSRKGECALFVEDTAEDGAYNDDTETAFALFLVPKITLQGSEDAVDYFAGSGALDDELYGNREDTN